MMRGVMDYRSLYFTPSLPLSALPLHIAAVNPLLFAVIERMAFWPWDMPADQQQSLLTVFTQEIQQARHENWRLSYPRDRRLQGWLINVHQGGLPPRLQQLAQKIGASERTISRIFIQETGMNYQSWRQQWRLLKAIELLADGAAIHHVAQQLEFISDSAFICFFRQHTGVTPMHYAREHLSIR
nr:AraC family transcriptional regulator [Orbus hercynius]